MQRLLEADANPNQATNRRLRDLGSFSEYLCSCSGMTPLMIATQEKDIEIICALLKAGADINQVKQYIVTCHLPRGYKLRWREDMGGGLPNARGPIGRASTGRAPNQLTGSPFKYLNTDPYRRLTGVGCDNIVACQAHPASVKIGPVLVPSFYF